MSRAKKKKKDPCGYEIRPEQIKENESKKKNLKTMGISGKGTFGTSDLGKKWEELMPGSDCS